MNGTIPRRIGIDLTRTSRTPGGTAMNKTAVVGATVLAAVAGIGVGALGYKLANTSSQTVTIAGPATTPATTGATSGPVSTTSTGPGTSSAPAAPGTSSTPAAPGTTTMATTTTSAPVDKLSQGNVMGKPSMTFLKFGPYTLQGPTPG